MGSLSNFAENELLDHVLKVGAYTPPTNIYVCLHTADPTDAGTGAEVADANGYARVACNVWNVAAARATANTNLVEFPQATGAGWGTVTHWSLKDSNVYGSGNMLAHGAFTNSKTIVPGNIPKIAAGELDISVVTGAINNYLANKLLDHLLKTAAYTVPTNLKVAFSTADPLDDGSGLAEPTGNNYARIICNTWDIASNGATQNTNAITSNVATGSWGTITHVVIFDDEATPNQLLRAAIIPSQPVGANDNLEYQAGGLDITLD